jgi:hypothetical protein
MVHKIQIDDQVRNATPEEVAKIEARAAEVAEAEAQLEAKATAKAALLQRLGMTDDEAALLLS